MKYKIKGTRHLKKYTAESPSPVYAANIDAIRVTEGLCDTPWAKTAESTAQMTYHTTEVVDKESGMTGLDLNVQIRDRFDAALFCAEHEAGMHRAYANAACYVFTLPDMSAYPNLTAVKVRVTSDPYNSSGVRLAVHVSDSPTIPASCSVAREGIAHAEGVMPRESRLGGDGKTYWYAATGNVDIQIASVNLKKYLFVVVGLENYSTTRGDWLEGSAFIDPIVEIVTDGEITGWNEGVVEDATESRSIVVREAGSFGLLHGSEQDVPCQLSLGSDYCIASQSGGPAHVAQRDSEGNITGWNTGTDFSSGNLDMSENSRFNNGRMGISTCYAQFREDKMTRCPLGFNILKTTLSPVIGASWCCGPGIDYRYYSSDPTRIFFGPSVIARKKLLSVFSLPLDFKARKIKLEWRVEKGGNIWCSIMKMKHNLWIHPGVSTMDYGLASLQRHELYTGELDKVSEWHKLVSVDEYIYSAEATTVTHIFDLPFQIGAGPHTLLFTVYADQDARPEDFAQADGDVFPVGTGWVNPTVRSAENILIFGGAIEGGWDPTVILIG